MAKILYGLNNKSIPGEIMEYYAHYDRKTGDKQKLIDHLNNVAVEAQRSVPPTVSFSILPNHAIKKLIYLIGKFHDLGKFTTYFQDYLMYNKDSALKHHAHISAIALYNYIKKNEVKSFFTYLENHRDEGALIFLIYLIVRLHHQNLTLYGLFSTSHSASMWKELNEQSKDLLSKSDIIQRTLDNNLYNLDIEKLFDIDEAKNDRQLTKQIMALFKTRLSHERWYFILIYLFSLLIDSDKLDSAQIKRTSLNNLPSKNVTEYVGKKHLNEVSTNFTDRRELARQTIVKQIEKMTETDLRENKIFSLTAPTGLGKTLSSLQAALILRERLEAICHYKPRIITAIPFINIINQTENDYKQVIGNNGRIIVHHRLADLKTSQGDKQEKLSLDQALSEVEAWEGDVILTTFVQLFQSLFTGQNRLLKKINKLAGSIVILDEIQSIPEKYMPLIGASIIKMSEYFGTRFILMTATQPRIIELGQKLLKNNENIDVLELLPNNEIYFNELTRTKILPRLDNPMDTEEFVTFFKKTWENKSSLIVVNMIKRSIELFKKLKNELGNDAHVIYLSTNIIPKHRAQVIDKVSNLLNEKETVVMVSTQTIEAGVDLDFEVGYRALAPLESIIQTAGRVNRKGALIDNNGNPITSKLYVVELNVDHQYVYKLHHLEKTKNLLRTYKEIEEKNYQYLVKQYYDAMLENPVDLVSLNIWEEGIRKLNFDEIEKFKLIESPGEVVDVFIESDEYARKLADAYEEIRDNKKTYNLSLFEGIIDSDFLTNLSEELNYYEKKSLLRQILSKMSEYMVQIRLKRYMKNRPFTFSERNGVNADFFWVPRENLNHYYDQDTGYMDESGESYLI